MATIEFRDGFKGGPTLLIVGAPESLAALAQKFVGLAASPVATRINLTEIAEVAPGIFIDLEVSESEGACGVKRVGDSRFSWRLTSAALLDFADKVRAVANSKDSSHAYLECPSDDVLVVASKDEYQ